MEIDSDDTNMGKILRNETAVSRKIGKKTLLELETRSTSRLIGNEKHHPIPSSE